MIREIIIFCVFNILILNVVSQETNVTDDKSEKGRIVGGSQVSDIRNLPYQVALWLYGYIFQCGGSIISSNKVVTAAHCVWGLASSDVMISAGSTYYYNSAALYYTSYIRIYPYYNPNYHNYDIAVIATRTPFTLSASVQPISMVTVRPAVNSYGVVSGWGSTVIGGSVVPYLRQTVVRIVDQNFCKNQYIPLGPLKEITSDMICAAYQGRDSCQGDSGGPLTVNGQLVGVVSWGEGCADPRYSGVYASVAQLRSWILSQ